MRKKKKEKRKIKERQKNLCSIEADISNPPTLTWLHARWFAREWAAKRHPRWISTKIPGVVVASCPVYSTREKDTVFRRPDTLDFRSRTRNGLRCVAYSARSFLLSASTVTRQELQIRSERFTPPILAQNLRKPRYRLLFLASALHSTDSTMIVRKARDLTPAKSEILPIPSGIGPPLNEAKDRRKEKAILNSPLRRESSRIAFCVWFDKCCTIFSCASFYRLSSKYYGVFFV